MSGSPTLLIIDHFDVVNTEDIADMTVVCGQAAYRYKNNDMCRFCFGIITCFLQLYHFAFAVFYIDSCLQSFVWFEIRLFGYIAVSYGDTEIIDPRFCAFIKTVGRCSDTFAIHIAIGILPTILEKEIYFLLDKLN